jgi:hypothetical protein
MDILPAVGDATLRLRVQSYPRTVDPDTVFNVKVEIVNRSPHRLNSCTPYPVYIAYHWMSEDASTVNLFEGQRSPLVPALRPNSVEIYEATVRSPKEAGKCRLRMTMLQENVRWFDEGPGRVASDVLIAVQHAVS